MTFLFVSPLAQKEAGLAEKLSDRSGCSCHPLEVLFHLSKPEHGISDVTAKTYADQITTKPIRRSEWAAAVTAALNAGEIERLSDSGHVCITPLGRKADGIRKTKPSSQALHSLITDALRAHPGSTRAQLLREIHQGQSSTFVSPTDFRTTCGQMERSGVVKATAGKLSLK